MASTRWPSRVRLSGRVARCEPEFYLVTIESCFHSSDEASVQPTSERSEKKGGRYMLCLSKYAALVAMRGTWVGAALIGLVINVPTTAACSVPSGSSGQWYAGGDQTPSQEPIDVRATINAYNPSPVYGSSSIWVMLYNTTSGYWAQTGWTHDNHLSNNEFAFVQYWKDNASYPTTNNFNYQYVPSGDWNYEVDRYSTGFQFYFGPYSLWGSGTSWHANQFESYNELHNYQNWASCGSCSPGVSAGDHAAGDASHILHVYNVDWIPAGGGAWQGASLAYQGQGSKSPGSLFGSADYQGVGSSGSSWTIYDKRCSN